MLYHIRLIFRLISPNAYGFKVYDQDRIMGILGIQKREDLPRLATICRNDYGKNLDMTFEKTLKYFKQNSTQ